MTMVSLTEAAARLSIDAKTLHRWLAEAQLALEPHPGDGRKKGLSPHQVHLLARLHGRSLAPLSQESVTGLPAPLPDPTAALLELSEQVGRLQEQISALQQQIAELTRRLESSPPALLSPAAPPRTRNKPSAAPAMSVARKTLLAKEPSTPVAVISRVEYAPGEGRYVVTCPKEGVLPFEPDSDEWFGWVKMQTSFRFVGQSGHFSAHHEVRVPRGSWRAFRHIRNRTYRQRLAPSKDLTIAVLEQAAAALEIHAN